MNSFVVYPMISDNEYWRFYGSKENWAKRYGLPVQPAYLQEFDTLSGTTPKRLLLAPVGHGKSWKATMVEALHHICYNKNARILIVSKTYNQAKNDIQMIRTEIERNEALRRDYLLESSERWGDESFTVKRAANLKEPTVTAAGLYGQVEGLRLTYIIGDDLIDWEVTFSEVEREKTKQWFDNTLQARLEPNGEMLIIGTRWHPSDLYEHILRKPGWFTKTYSAILPNGQALWPEQWSLDKLAMKRAEEGEIAFQLKSMNNPMALEGAAFKGEWLENVEAYPSGMRIVVGVDPAATRKELAKADPDATALVVVGEKSGILYLLDIVIAYIDSNYADLINAIFEKWKPSEVAVESNTFQKLIIHDTRERYPQIPIWAEEHYSKDKVTRILDLQPRFQSHAIRIWTGCANLDRFKHEYATFPRGSHDDILDALEIAVKRATNRMDTSAAGVWLCEACEGKEPAMSACAKCRGTGTHIFQL